MKCPSCHKEMQCRLGSHHYTESGLDNVYLTGVEIWTCPCGEEIVGIPAIPELNEITGRDIIGKTSRLSGKEIRFLRKNVGMSAKKMAEVLGVSNATVSRWENGERLPELPTDRLIRLIYGSLKGVPSAMLVESFKEITGGPPRETIFNIPRELWNRSKTVDAVERECAKYPKSPATAV